MRYTILYSFSRVRNVFTLPPFSHLLYLFLPYPLDSFLSSPPSPVKIFNFRPSDFFIFGRSNFCLSKFLKFKPRRQIFGRAFCQNFCFIVLNR
nr:MAG TPA: hypothetical protein [Caudoviricetes sp.]